MPSRFYPLLPCVVSVNGWTALHWAAKRGYVEICILLLKHGANCDIINASNQIPSQLTNDAHLHNLLSSSGQSIPTNAIKNVTNEDGTSNRGEVAKEQQELKNPKEQVGKHVDCHSSREFNNTSIENRDRDTEEYSNNIAGTDVTSRSVFSSEIALQPHSFTSSSIDDCLFPQFHHKEGYTSSRDKRDYYKIGGDSSSRHNSCSGSDATSSGITNCLTYSAAVVAGVLNSDDVETLVEEQNIETDTAAKETAEQTNPNAIVGVVTTAAAEQSPQLELVVDQVEQQQQQKEKNYSVLSCPSFSPSGSLSNSASSFSCLPPEQPTAGDNNNASCNNFSESKPVAFDEQQQQSWSQSDSGNNSSGGTIFYSIPQKAPKIANTCHHRRHINNSNPTSLHSSNTTSKHPITESASNNHPESDKITSQDCYSCSSSCEQNSNTDSTHALFHPEDLNNLSTMPSQPTINLVPSYMSRVRPPTTATCGSLSSYNEEFTYPWKKLQTKAHSMPTTPPNNSNKSESVSLLQSPLVQNNSPSIYHTNVLGASNYLAVIKNGTSSSHHNSSNNTAAGSASNFDMNPSPVASGSGIFSSNESVPIAVGETNSGNMEVPVVITSGGRILKVRVSDQCDKDFVEIDLPASKLSIQVCRN